MSAMNNNQNTISRVGWVDFSKGICIILVVLLNVTYGVEQSTGSVTIFNVFNEWARPFRMPDFFFIAGLFLMRRIDRPWRSYLDTKVVHFAYFYVIWMTIWYLVRLPQYIGDMGLESALLLYLVSFIEPLGSLWFIYMLAVFFVAAKALKSLPVWLVFAGAAVLHSLQIDSGWRVIDEFGARFIYFYAGYVFAPYAFAFAQHMSDRKGAVLIAGLTIWAVINAWMVTGQLAQLPGISLVLGFVGTGAVVTAGVLLAKTRLGNPVRYLGANTLVVFLSYFLFSVAARIILLKTGIITDASLIVVLATLAGVIGPVIAHWIVKRTPLAFLYRRPEAFKIPQDPAPTVKQNLQSHQ